MPVLQASGLHVLRKILRTPGDDHALVEGESSPTSRSEHERRMGEIIRRSPGALDATMFPCVASLELKATCGDIVLTVRWSLRAEELDSKHYLC
jgi:hypothetical protein